MTLKEYLTLHPEYSLSKIAREVPCTPQHIIMIANGKRKPSFDIAKKIEQITNGSVAITNWYK